MFIIEEDSAKQQPSPTPTCTPTSHKQANVFGAGLFHFNGNVYH